MLLNSSAGPVPGPWARRVIVPSSTFQSTWALIRCNSPAASRAIIQPRRSPKVTGFRAMVIHSPYCGRKLALQRVGGKQVRVWAGITGAQGGRLRRLALARGELHCLDDLRIGRAAAEIAR